MNDRLDVKCSVKIQLNSGNTEPRKIEVPGLLRLRQLVEDLKRRNKDGNIRPAKKAEK